MKRKIKFRIWDKDGNEMISGDGFTFDDYIPINYMFNDSNRFVFMQWTGLRDKNYNEIYEGDKVEYDGEVYSIIYKNYQFIADEFCDLSLSFPYDFFGENVYKNCEVIGNIYENN